MLKMPFGHPIDFILSGKPNASSIVLTGVANATGDSWRAKDDRSYEGFGHRVGVIRVDRNRNGTGIIGEFAVDLHVVFDDVATFRKPLTEIC